jgi:arylsulfatase A-like enzyme
MIGVGRIRLVAVFVVLVGGAASSRAPGAETPGRPPNLLVVLMDNIGQDWFGCYGSLEGQTPEIDKLAARGVRFRHCYVVPLCSTSRHVFFTGRYPFRTGWTIHHDAAIYGGGYFDWEREITFVRALRSAGYATALAGKWQINNLFDQPDALAKHGFDEHCVFPEGPRGHPAHTKRYWDPYVLRDGRRVDAEGEFGPRLFTDYLIDFFRRHRDRPFLAVYATVLTHLPVTKTPLNRGEDLTEREQLGGMVRYADHCVGRLVAALDELGLRENTIVLITTDNGTPAVFGGRVGGRVFRAAADTMVEGDMKEGSIDVPMIVHCPGLVPGRPFGGGSESPTDGRVSDALVDSSDVFPTLLELAGAPPPQGVTIDGRSFAPILRGAPDAASPREWIFSQYAHHRVVRNHRYKLRSDGRFHDLVRDPLEEHDLAGSEDPAIIREREELQRVLDSFPPDAELWFEPRSISARRLKIGDADRRTTDAKLAPEDPNAQPPGSAAELGTGTGKRSAYSYRIGWATRFGGSEWEEAREVIELADASVLVGGQTASDDMPVTPGVVQPTYRGEPAGTGHGGLYGGDMFLVRLRGDGRRVIASTYFGGSKQERSVYGMALDRQGNVVFSTGTRSPDLRTTPGAYQPEYGGGDADMTAAKVTPDLERLVWCTYVGKGRNDWGRGGLALDRDDNVYLIGRTASADFPTSPGAFQRRQRGGGDAVVVKLTSDGARLVYATRIGGSGEESIIGARVDDQGNVHLGGHTWSSDFPTTSGAPQRAFGGGKADAFLAGICADGSRLLYSTLLGGRENEFAEHRLALLGDGSVLLSGFVGSPDFPTTPGAYQPKLRGPGDGFLTKLSADRRRFVFSTFLGGSGAEEFYLMPSIDAQGNIFLVGSTGSPDFPVTPGALRNKHGGGKTDGVLAVVSADGSELLYATFLGGRGDELVRSVTLGRRGEVYLVGRTNSEDFPVTPEAAQRQSAGKFDAFVVKLVPNEEESP